MGPLCVKPSLIVGDFDSYENPHLEVETIVLPCEKDNTVYAMKEAVKRGFDTFLLIGVIGGRLDHPRAMYPYRCISMPSAKRLPLFPFARESCC